MVLEHAVHRLAKPQRKAVRADRRIPRRAGYRQRFPAQKRIEPRVGKPKLQLLRTVCTKRLKQRVGRFEPILFALARLDAAKQYALRVDPGGHGFGQKEYAPVRKDA